MRGRAWTAAEVRVVERAWGVRGSTSIARELGRTRRAVESLASKRHLGAPNRGRLTPYSIEREFGFCRIRVAKACERLGIEFRRAIAGPGTVGGRKPGHRRYVPEERLDELLAFLAAWPDGERLYALGGARTDARLWGTGGKPAACRACGRADRPHRLKGWCAACASREQMRERRAKQRAIESASAAWRAA